MQPEHHFGKAESRILDRDAMVAGKRDFESAAKTISVNDRDRRQWQPVEPIEDGVTARE